MLTIETKEIEISKDLLKRVEMICKFACVKPTITNGNIKNIKGTNIAYVKPHIIKINNIDYLSVQNSDMPNSIFFYFVLSKRWKGEKSILFNLRFL